MEFVDDVVLFERAAKRARELRHPEVGAKLTAIAGALTRLGAGGGSREKRTCEKCGADVLRLTIAEDQGGGWVDCGVDVATTVQVAGRKLGRAWVVHQCVPGAGRIRG